MTESVFAALLADRPAALQLLPERFQDLEAWRRAADRAASRQPAWPLVDELVRQSRVLPPSSARDRHIETLSHPGTTVIVTGQQLGLFGGPLYTLHKAATTIARAKTVSALTGRPCVPLFWLQTEDHDYPEIAATTVAAPGGHVTFALSADPTPSRISIAHRTVPPEIDAVVDEVREALSSLPYAEEVLRLLRTHYVAGRSLPAAFGGLIAELFAEEGLVVFNPRVPAVSRLTAPLFARVLREHDAIANVLDARATAIHAAHYIVQIPPRPGASLAFFHPEGVTGPRYRLNRRIDSGEWETPHGPISTAALTGWLEREPLRFSSSALLRPLTQDFLFPTCAYVGGPAEVSYLAQLSPLYERLEVPFPLIAPRARLRLIDPTVRSLLDRLGVSAADVETSRDTLLARVATRPANLTTAAELETRLLGPLAEALDALHELGFHNLKEPIRKARDACAATIGKLAGKVERAVLERDQVATERVDRVRAALYPNGAPQERAHGFLALGARAGTATLTRAILAAADTLDPRPSDVLL